GTTLGADNGIAVAMGMAILEDNTLEHPALEVLVTVNEEDGMNEISFKLKDKTVKTITALDDITIYHKLAIKDMAKGDKVTKYGE
ncbi:hypothetical protein ACTPEM_26265, partial [Clostridioides difficile]